MAKGESEADRRIFAWRRVREVLMETFAEAFR
jgi:hypothetical protein